MGINRIAAENYKRGNVSQPIAPVHVFTGPTGCGKTTLLDLVSLAIRAVPLDAEYSRIDFIHRDFATNGEMIKAQIKLDNGLALTRFIGRDKKGKVSQGVNFLGEKLGKVAAEKKIAEILNPCAEALDFGLFRAKRAIERQAYLLGLCESPKDWDRAKVWTTCAMATAGSPNELSQAILEELFEVWPDIPMKATDGVLKLKDKIRDMISVANKDALHKATLEDELARYVDVAAGTVDVAKADQALSGDLTAVTRKLHDKQARKEDLIKLIAAETEKAGEHTRWANAKGLLDGEVKSAQDSYETVKAGGATDDIEAAETKLHPEETMEQLKQELSDLEGKLPDLQSAKEETKAEYIEARNKLDAYRQLLGFLGNEERICPIAGDLLKRCTAEWDEDELETTRFNAEVECNGLKKKADIAKALRDECRNEIEKLTTTIRHYERDNDNLTTSIAAIKKVQASHDEAVKMREEAVVDSQKRYDDHIAAEPHAQGVADVEKAEQEKLGIETTIATLQADISTKTESKGRKLAMLRAEKTRLELGVKIEVYKTLRVTIGELIEEILTLALGEIKLVINLCLPTDWGVAFDSDDDGFFVGAYIPDVGAVVSLNSMSAGQQAIFAVAVRIALMNAAEVKLRVLLCEMDTLDIAYTEQVLDIAVEAVEQGYLDNFIGATNKNVPEIEGVHISVLDGATTAKEVA